MTDNTCITGGGSGSGGGIYCYSAAPEITGNVFSGNAGIYGGGVHYAYCSSGTLTNNIVHGNGTSGQTMGGGIYLDNSSVDITNNTVAANSAGWGGGFYASENSFPTITNMILWGNEYEEIYIGMWYTSSTVTISYSDVDGGLSGCYVDPSCTLDWGAGIIESDPLFVDSAADDFHLTCISPCYGAGDNAASSLPSEDFESDPRVIHDFAEIGADEFFCHLYILGSPVPGNSIDVLVAGIPGQEVMLYRGSDVLEFPIWTGNGYLRIHWPAVGSWYLGLIPNTGVLQLPVTVPLSWVPGKAIPSRLSWESGKTPTAG